LLANDDEYLLLTAGEIYSLAFKNYKAEILILILSAIAR
jgi:hypothetical protein